MRDTNSKGGRKRRVTDADLLDVFRATSDPVLSTAEVAEAVPIKRRGVLTRLRRLEEDGDLDSKQIGGRNTVWWTVEKAERRRESDPAPEPTEHRGGGDHAGETGEELLEGSGDLVGAVREHLEANDLPPKTPHGRGAVIDVLRYLREHGTAGSGELQDAVHPSYEDNWSTPRTMWNAIDRYLEDVPGVDKGGYGEWEYTGDGAVREAINA